MYQKICFKNAEYTIRILPKTKAEMLKFWYRLWMASKPEGETKDHPLINPFGPLSPNMESMDLDPILVAVGGTDVLRDRVEDYAKRLKSWGEESKTC